MSWLTGLRRYLAVLVAGNLVWEALHMPLYTLWETGTFGQIVLYGLHCTVGDVLIGTSALLAALLMFGDPGWPARGFGRVAAWAVLFGFAYTVGSEWYNVTVRASWAYADAMPTIFGIGLTPLAQWIVVPALGFWWARRGARP